MDYGEDITQLLRDSKEGPGAADRLYRAVYDRLRQLAHARLRGQAADRTLGTTALVNEAYLKLVDPAQADYRDRNHFLAVAATAMRQIVIDDARRSAALKRGGVESNLELQDEIVAGDAPAAPPVDLIALDRALTRLAEVDERLCRVVEMRFFAGYSVAETAAALESSERTVKRDWRKARALLYRELLGSDADQE